MTMRVCPACAGSEGDGYCCIECIDWRVEFPSSDPLLLFPREEIELEVELEKEHV